MQDLTRSVVNAKATGHKWMQTPPNNLLDEPHNKTLGF